MPGDPKECREHAQHWLELANSAPTLIAKMRFEGLAHTWLRLANDLEHATALLECRDDTKMRKTG